MTRQAEEILLLLLERVVITPCSYFPTDDNKILVKQLPFESTLGNHIHKFKKQTL